MAIRATAVWPIDRYEEGTAPVRQDLADNVDDPTDPGAGAALTAFVNAHDPQVVPSAVEPQPDGLDTVLAIVIPSIEGNVTYHYLASLA